MFSFNDYIHLPFRKQIIYVLAACVLVLGPASNATAQTQPRDWTVLGQEVLEQRRKVAELREQEQKIIDEIDRVGFTLDVHKRELDRIKAEMDNIEKDLKLLSQKIILLENSAETSTNAARASLIKLYKARMLGSIGTLASADSLINLSLRQKIINSMLQQEYATTQSLTLNIAQLGVARNEMLDMQAYKNKKLAESQAKLKEVNAIRAENEKLLANIAKETNLQLAALQYMEASSQRLDAQLLKLNAVTLNTQTPTQKISMGASFAASKGLLIMPVTGTITTKYGTYKPPGENVELFRKGVDIKAAPKAQVSAVFAGTVVYADWFKGYGNMLIIDHGDGYFTVYARLGKMYKNNGSVVLGGEAIGEINDDSGISGSELYFEIRQHAQPLNPAVWLAKNR